MMSFLKQLADLLSSPLVFACLLLAVAGLLRIRGRKRAATSFVVLAGSIVYAASVDVSGNLLLTPLESRYEAAVMPVPAGVSHIVVLGSGYTPRDAVPVTGALDRDGLARVTESIRLYHATAGAHLIVTGGAERSGVPPSHGYAELARQLGVSRISVLDAPLDTCSEAQAVRATIGNSPFMLVTSAFHMPRAMALMRDVGGQPVAAPTAQRVDARWTWLHLIPSASGLAKTELAAHEYVRIIATHLGSCRLG